MDCTRSWGSFCWYRKVLPYSDRTCWPSSHTQVRCDSDTHAVPLTWTPQSEKIDQFDNPERLSACNIMTLDPNLPYSPCTLTMIPVIFLLDQEFLSLRHAPKSIQQDAGEPLLLAPFVNVCEAVFVLILIFSPDMYCFEFVVFECRW